MADVKLALTSPQLEGSCKRDLLGTVIERVICRKGGAEVVFRPGMFADLADDTIQGVDIHYPADNRRLFDEIAEGGAVVSEFPIGTKPEPWRFPARNRLISGTSLGVLVLESPIDSGSLITAREAGDQGRDVFAVPGPIDTGRNAGCHKLIQDGAKLVENVQDILDELGVLSLRSPSTGDTPSLAPAPVPNLPPEQRRILDMLTLQPRHVDGMIAESGLTAPQVSGILTLLEMRGLAKRVPGNAFVRVL